MRGRLTIAPAANEGTVYRERNSIAGLPTPSRSPVATCSRQDTGADFRIFHLPRLSPGYFARRIFIAVAKGSAARSSGCTSAPGIGGTPIEIRRCWGQLSARYLSLIHI